MPFQLELEKTDTPVVSIALEPALNAFGSLLLLAKHESDPGIHPWVTKTRSQMSAEEYFRHRLVAIGLYYAVAPQQSFASFPDYLSDLESAPAARLRDVMLEAYTGICAEGGKTKRKQKVNWEEILTSPKKYVEFLKTGFGDEHVDDELETRAYDYVLDPEAMKRMIVDHMRWFWVTHLEAEWTRVRPMIEQSVHAFQRVDLSGMSRIETARLVTGQELNDPYWVEMLEKAGRVIFVPNAHIGPYIHKSMVNETLHVFFGARQPDSEEERIPELDRVDIVSRLSALADDTRLQILQMIAEDGEMRAQDLIDALRLSQPSVSRYLTQLTVAGYLLERRANSAKVYSLNRDRIEKTLKAVSAFLLGH